MSRPLWLIAAQLAARCHRLENRVVHLETSLALAHGAVRKITDERDQARRDVDLMCLMANDRRIAAEFVQSSHNLKRLPEAKHERD